MAKFELTKEDTFSFARKNRKGMMIVMKATEEYAAARCCLLNFLFSGLLLAPQAVEKMLKGFLYFNHIPVPKIHSTLTLKNKLKEKKDYKLDKYDYLFKRLDQHYQSRYPDNQNRSKTMFIKELEEIDVLWVELVEKLPIPDEVKYKSGTYTFLFDFTSNGKFLGWTKTMASGVWIMKDNLALKPKLNMIKKRYLEVHNHLYPSVD